MSPYLLFPVPQAKSVRTLGLFAVAFAAVFCSLILLSRPAAAATCNFLSVGDNDFNTAGNWDCDGSPAVPTSADDVLIGAGTTTNLSASVTVANVSVSGTLNAVASLLQVTDATTIEADGTVTSTSGILAFNTVTSTGSLGTGSGIITATSTVQNNGTFDVGAGTATTTGAFTNSVSGTLNGGNGILAFVGDFSNAGTFSAQSGTVRVGGAADQSIAGELYNLFVSLKSDGTATFAASTTILSTLSANGAGGTVSGGSTSLTVVDAATILSGASVSSTSGTLTFNAAVSSTGSLGSTSGNMQFDLTLQNNGWFAVGSGIATTTGNLTNATSGTVNNNTGTLVLEAHFTNSGTFNGNTGTVRLHSGNAQNLGAATFYKLTVQKSDGTVATMTGNSTVSNAFTLVTGILSVNTRTFTVSGTYTNSGGQVTISSGTIVHALTSNAFTTSSGGATSTARITFTSGGGLYVTLEDDNRNLSATNTETLTVTASVTSASGSDSETLTLTETAVASGIFRNATALPLSYVVNATINDGTLTVNASDTGTVSYTDTYDATDTGTDTITITIATSAPAASSDTGGGGLAAAGGGGSSGLVPVTTEFQEVVVDGAVIPVHTLVKLICPAGAEVNHPCTAVYYVSSQGKRHAFPNDKVYFTWYTDFSGVQIISDSQMAGITLGKNVTYKPGVKMVKFTTDPKVYAVEKGGVLRWVTSEAVAITLYGSSWNMMIDDINDAFYSNYRFGNDISSSADFDPAAATVSVTHPSDSLQM